MVFFKSAPAEKDLSPAPVTMEHQTSGSSLTSIHACDSSLYVSGSIAFIASGLFIVMYAI